MRSLRFLAFALLVSCSISAAFAQSSAGFTQGQVPTVAEWNALFAGKVDVSGGNGSAVNVTASNQTAARTLAAWLGDVPNVKGFGAQLNGTTDDTTAFNAARGATPTNGSVFVPPGGVVEYGATSGPATAVLWKMTGNSYGTGTTPVTQIGTDLVENFFSGTKYFGRPQSAIDGNPVVRVDIGYANQSSPVGTSGNVTAGIEINGTQGNNVNDSVWNVNSILTSNANAAVGGWPQPSAGSFSVNKQGTATTWGLLVQSSDTNTAGATTSGDMIGLEVDFNATGTDPNVGRRLINLAANYYGTGNTGHVGAGVFIQSEPSETIDNAIYIAGAVPIGINLTQVTGSNTRAMQMLAGSVISFDVNNTGNLGEANGALVSSIPVQLPVYTVASLPACSSSVKGSVAVASDANAPTWGSTLAGSGTTVVTALCNGTAWVAN